MDAISSEGTTISAMPRLFTLPRFLRRISSRRRLRRPRQSSGNNKQDDRALDRSNATWGLEDTSRRSRLHERNTPTLEVIKWSPYAIAPSTSLTFSHPPTFDLESATPLSKLPRKGFYRPCLILIILAVVTLVAALVAGIYWSLRRDDMGGAWAVASFIAFVGGIPITIAGTVHFQRCRCWSYDDDWE